MVKDHRLAALRPLLLGIIVLLVSLGALVLVVDKNSLLSPYSYPTRPYITEPFLQPWDCVSKVRVARVVSWASLTQWITVSILLTAFWSFHQKRAPKFAGSVGSPQRLGLHIVSMLDRTKLAQNCPLNAKGPESTRPPKDLEVITPKDITGSDKSAGMDGLSFVIHGTKEFENITKSDTLVPILAPDLHVFRMVELETETIENSPAPASSVASSRPIDENMEDRINGPFTSSHAHDLLETANALPNLGNHWRAIETEPQLSILNQHWQQTTTQPTIPETHPAPLGSPLHPQQANGPIIGGVGGSRSIEVQGPTRTFDRSRRVLPESVQYGDCPLEYSHTILSDVSRNRIIDNVSSDEGYPQNIQHSSTGAPPTTAPMSSMAIISQGMAPVTSRSYRPMFQPLTPALVRFTQAEQPWSPELQRPAASVRRAKLQDDLSRVDALLNQV